VGQILDKTFGEALPAFTECIGHGIHLVDRPLIAISKEALTPVLVNAGLRMHQIVSRPDKGPEVGSGPLNVPLRLRCGD